MVERLRPIATLNRRLERFPLHERHPLRIPPPITRCGSDQGSNQGRVCRIPSEENYFHLDNNCGESLREHPLPSRRVLFPAQTSPYFPGILRKIPNPIHQDPRRCGEGLRRTSLVSSRRLKLPIFPGLTTFRPIQPDYSSILEDFIFDETLFDDEFEF